MTKPTGLRGNTSGALFEVTRTLTSSDILSLQSSAFVMVAGEAGKLYIPVAAWCLYRFVAEPYADCVDVEIVNNVDGLYVLKVSAAFWLDGVADGFAVLNDNEAQPAAALASFSGADLTVTSQSDPTNGGGDPLGTLDVTVLYTVVDVD